MAYNPGQQQIYNQVSQGMTGFTSVKSGDLIFSPKNNAEALGRLPIGNPGQILMVSTDKFPKWVTLAGFLRSGLPASISDLSVDTLTIDTLNGVLKASSGLVSGSAVTDDLPESGTPTNKYFTEARTIEVIDQQIEDGRLSSWYKMEIPYGYFSIAALTNTIDFITLDSGELLETVKIESTNLTAPSLTTFTSSIGILGSLTKYCKTFNVLTNKKVCRTDIEETNTLKLTVTADVNLDTFTDGSITIRYKTSKEI